MSDFYSNPFCHNGFIEQVNFNQLVRESTNFVKEFAAFLYYGFSFAYLFHQHMILSGYNDFFQVQEDKSKRDNTAQQVKGLPVLLLECVLRGLLMCTGCSHNYRRLPALPKKLSDAVPAMWRIERNSASPSISGEKSKNLCAKNRVWIHGIRIKSRTRLIVLEFIRRVPHRLSYNMRNILNCCRIKSIFVGKDMVQYFYMFIPLAQPEKMCQRPGPGAPEGWGRRSGG